MVNDVIQNHLSANLPKGSSKVYNHYFDWCFKLYKNFNPNYFDVFETICLPEGFAIGVLL